MSDDKLQQIIQFFSDNHRLKGIDDHIVRSDCEKLRKMLTLGKPERNSLYESKTSGKQRTQD